MKRSPEMNFTPRTNKSYLWGIVLLMGAVLGLVVNALCLELPSSTVHFSNSNTCIDYSLFNKSTDIIYIDATDRFNEKFLNNKNIIIDKNLGLSFVFTQIRFDNKYIIDVSVHHEPSAQHEPSVQYEPYNMPVRFE